MDEMNLEAMLDLQDELTAKLLDPNHTGADRKQTIAELKIVAEALKGYIEQQNEQERVDAEREKAEASVRVSEIEADANDRQSKRELIGNVVRAAGQIGSSLVGLGATALTVWKIVDAEAGDRLVLSKALGFIPKIFKS